jgi:hypothetical protein
LSDERGGDARDYRCLCEGTQKPRY